MRKNVTLLVIASALCIVPLSSCGSEKKKVAEAVPKQIISQQADEESAKVEQKESTAINIPKTTGFLETEAYDKIRAKDPAFGGQGIPVMNTSDRKKYKIDEINCIIQEKVIYGKLVHKTDSWRMESIIGYTPDHMTQEYFVFYDGADNYINCFKAGSHLFYAGDFTSSEIEGNKILCKTEWVEPGVGGGINYVQYEITPQLTVKEIKKWEETDEDE